MSLVLTERIPREKVTKTPLRLLTAFDSGVVGATSIAEVLGVSVNSVTTRASKGNLSYTLLDGTTFHIDVTRAGEGQKAKLLFAKKDIDLLKAGLEKEKRKFVTVTSALEELAKLGLPMGKNNLIDYFKHGGASNSKRKFELDGVTREIELRTGKTGGIMAVPPRYLLRKDFEFLVKWVKKGFDPERAAKSTHGQKEDLPEGYVWAADASVKLGLDRGMIRNKIRRGELKGVKINGNNAITIVDFERLKLECTKFRTLEKPIKLRGALQEIEFEGAVHLSNHISKIDGKMFFRFEDENGHNDFIPVHIDKDSAYVISKEDFERMKAVQSKFSKDGVYCDLEFVATTIGISTDVLNERIEKPNLVLTLPEGTLYKITMIKRQNKKWFKRSDIKAYEEKCSEKNAEMVFRDDISRRLGITIGSYYHYFESRNNRLKFTLNSKYFDIRLRFASRDGQSKISYLLKSELDAIERHRNITDGKKGKYIRLSQAFEDRISAKFLEMRDKRVFPLTKNKVLAVPLEEVDGIFYVQKKHVVVFRLFGLLYSNRPSARANAGKLFAEIAQANGDNEITLTCAKMICEHVKDEVDVRVLGSLKPIADMYDVPLARPYSQIFGEFLNSHIPISSLDTSTFSVAEHVEKTRNGYRVLLSDYYGIEVPIDSDKTISLEHAALLEFYINLFHSNSTNAYSTISNFLTNGNKIKNEVELAKLWLCRDYYLLKDEEGGQKKKIHSLLKKQDFRYYVPKNSRIFTKGTPIADGPVLLEWFKLFEDSPYINP